MEKSLSRWLVVLAVLLCSCAAWAQVKVIRGGIAVPAVADEAKAEGEKKFEDGPGLKTDPEAQQLLGRAEQFVKDERFDLAAVLWQKVLDDAGDNLVSVDGRLYISLRRQVEQRLATLPKIALSTYRVSADGEAQALVAAAGADKEEDALSQVLRRFFMSSLGDDAAYKLGCIALDRHDFVGASRLFAKVLEEHPDPSMPRSDLLLRLAVAAGRVGDRDGAYKYLTAIEKLSGARPPRALLGAVVDDVKTTSAAAQFVSARLAMPQLPVDATSKTLTEFWSYEYPMIFQEQPLNRNMAYAVYDGSGRQNFDRKTIPRDQVIDRWKSNGWMPAGKLLFGDGRVYFKTNNNITCWSTRGEDKVLWESLWNNDFEIDEFSQQLVMMAQTYNMQGMQNDTRPRSPAEILLFGDQIHQDMSLIGGKIYSIEGKKYPKKGQPELAKAPKPFNYNSTPRRSRSNFLSAYDARTGKVQWNRAADDDVKDGSEGGVGFMAAPVACGNVLLTPMTDGGAMWLYGISPDDGKTLWKTYLCDEPAGGCEPWAPMGVAVEGRDAYVLCGAGVVFAVDGTSGAIRWVVRYNRTPKGTSGRRAMRTAYGMASRLEEYSGWSEDKLIPLGRQLVVMASDYDKLLCLDARTGDLLWDSPRTQLSGEASYCIGVKGPWLYVAGKSTVRCYNVVSGKFTWEYPDKDDPPMESFGRGVLTEDSLYLPVKDSVLKLALSKQEPGKSQAISQVGVALSVAARDPVGNLYSDGEKLWVLSANRIYSLTHLEYRMQALEKRIQAGDPAALLDRSRLLARSEQWDQAMNDLRSAHALIAKQQDRDAAATAVFGAFDELKLTTTRPADALDTVAQLFTAEETPLKPEQRVKLDGVLSSALSTLQRVKSPSAAANVLAAAPLYKQDFLVLSAARTLKAVATPADKGVLQEAVTGGKEPASFIAAEAWAIADPEAAKPVLKPWLGSGDNKVKLLTARALLQAGDASALPTLIEMLGGADIPTCNRAFQTLRTATGKSDLIYTAYANAEDRNKQIQAWRDWYEANKDGVKLVTPLPETGTQLGRTLICWQNRNQIVEIDASGKEISRKNNIPQPWSAFGMSNGNRLVASPQQPRVVEYDSEWKEVWSVDGLPSGTWSVDRALDGNTVVACRDALQVIEIKAGTKEKKVLWRGDGSGMPVNAKRLENGNTLICLQGLNKVIEVDAAGKQIWETSNVVNPFTAQRLENGNTLIAAMVNGGNGSIVEVDSKGAQVKVHKQGLRALYAAERLLDGGIMYVDQQGFHKIDAEGKPLIDRKEPNATGFSNF